MRAAVRTRYGPPDVVRVLDVDPPRVGDGDVLVRVHATTVNRTDCAYRAGTPFPVRLLTGFPRPRVQVLGTEFAGVVERTGPAVTRFSTGQRVFGYVEGRFGAHAELLAVAGSASVALLPPGVGFAEGAAATEGAHYALAMARVARVARGQRVLVLGATGAIGSAAVQLLAAGGVRVTAVAPGHREAVEALGADRVVTARAEDVVADGTRFAAVFDAVGRSTFGRCRDLLEPRGVYTSSELGPRGQNVGLALLSPLSPGRRVRFPFPRHDQAMVGRIADLLGSGRFRPLLDPRRFGLAEITEAHRYAGSGRKTGSVVVQVAEG
ncbi:NAD(P)-dependent alcohol dehydrogenase [Trujillonella humicola]|uniref:NAD(P)-dependent alcohol dehydrogenase n=1 Tax=Trujillonella humicola TaxID=3383699 RepID=UPI00390649CC